MQKKTTRSTTKRGENEAKRKDDPARSVLVAELAATVRQAVRGKLGPNSTFEQRRDAAAELMQDALWKDTDTDLRELVTDAEEVEVEGRLYRRLKPPSSAMYFGRWGSHAIEERLYREAGVHNGPTIKPIELRVGMIENMTPDFARIVGALGADRSSRGVERTLRTVGLSSPSRAFLADRTTEMGAEIADDIETMESASRESKPLPAGIASASCGLDRMSTRMAEPMVGAEATESAPPRTKPYERTPPPPKEHHYRKAWVGSLTVYDAEGKELQTWRYAVDAAADPNQLADRVAADAAWILAAYPDVPLHSIQDAAPELRALPEALARVLPANTTRVDLVDFKHLTDYLDKVVDACEPDGDPHDLKGWFRGELLRDDQAIDRIWRNLRERAKKLEGEATTTLTPRATPARDAVAAALSYIRRRKDKMRYASLYAANLPIGSGATESTCFQMQTRVKLPGQSWEPRGLRAVLVIRALVLSERWETAWLPYAAKHRKDVRIAA